MRTVLISYQEKLQILCNSWNEANRKYFFIYREWSAISNALDSGENYSLKHITSLHDQGYINHRIAQKYRISEIPVYDFRDWFVDINSILTSVVDKFK